MCNKSKVVRYPIEPKDRIFVKGYNFFCFASNMSKNVGENLSKSVSGKFSQKLFDYAKQYATDTFKTASKKVVKKKSKTRKYWTW